VVLPVEVADDDAVLLAVLDTVEAGDLVTVDELVGGGVLLDVPVVDGVPVVVGVPVHDGHTGRDTYGAMVTPRNAVLARAMASVALVLVIELYEYSLVGEVAYNTNAPQLSDRPAMEMIMVPDSSSMAAVGVCRVHAVPEMLYCAILFVARLAVSVIHTEVAEAHTNPYGRKEYETLASRFAPAPAATGGAVPTVNELTPPAGYGWVPDDSVYMSAVFWYPHPMEPNT